MSWDYLLVQATNGAVIGVIYALIAVGVTLIFSILKIVNFAHGDLYMLGGYCAYFVIEASAFPAGRDGRRDGGAVRGSHRPRAPDADAAL